MEPLNRTAVELVDEAIDFADELGVAVHHLDNEAVVLDLGVEAPGGVEAGLLLAEIRAGGLATVSTRVGSLDGAPRLVVETSTDHPALALLGSQRAGWRLPDGAWGSGPAQLLREDAALTPGHAEAFDFAVLAVEAATLPDADLASDVAAAVGVPSSGTFLPTAPAASPAGAVALAAGAAEVAVHRLERLGYDPSAVRSAAGSAPVPPVAGDEATARARANDAVAYGARVHLVVEEPVDRLDDLPFGATRHAGASFETLLADVDGDLGALEDAFAPACATVDVVGGETRTVGAVDGARLADAWGADGGR